MHIPGDTEIQNDIAFQPNIRGSEIIHAKFVCAFRLSYLGIRLRRLAKEAGCTPRHRQGLRISDGVEHHVQRITANIADRAQPRFILLYKGFGPTDRYTMAAAASCLNVVNLAQFSRLDNFFNHLHVGVITRLKSDGNDFTAFLFRAANGDGFVQSHRHRLFQQYMQPVFQRVNRALCMRAVVCADTDRIHRHGVDHIFIAFKRPGLHLIFFKKFPCLIRDDIGPRNNFHIRLFHIALHMAIGYASGSDNANP